MIPDWILEAVKYARECGHDHTFVKIPDMPYGSFVAGLRAKGLTVERDGPNTVRIRWENKS